MKDFVVIVEWNTLVGILLWILSFRKEWKHVYLTFGDSGQITQELPVVME